MRMQWAFISHTSEVIPWNSWHSWTSQGLRKRLVHPRFYVPVYQIKANSSPYLEENNNQQCNVTFWKEISYNLFSTAEIFTPVTIFSEVNPVIHVRVNRQSLKTYNTLKIAREQSRFKFFGILISLEHLSLWCRRVTSCQLGLSCLIVNSLS